MKAAAAKHDGAVLSDNAITVLERRYLCKDENGQPIETPDEMFRRVANNVAQAELAFDQNENTTSFWADEFYGIMTGLEFLPNSPTLMNAGTKIQQLSACFVLPIEDSMDAIFDAIKNTALIHKSGGGTGFSFSRLRPKDDVVSSTKGVSSGPVSFMKVFDAATEAVKQGGRRRGANMAILDIDHPDILEFLRVKEENDSLTNFNISVGLTDQFMEAVRGDGEYSLINPRTLEPSGQLHARTVFETIATAAWKNGEPGIIFIDRINRDNPTPALGRIESTNPCGEQPLLPFESCNLGSLNLGRMVRDSNSGPVVDYERIKEVVHIAVRFLDDVIEMNSYPIPEIERVTKQTRKIGLGVMGFADMLVQLNIPYDTEEAVELAENLMDHVRSEARAASSRLGEERGAFPAFDASVYGKAGGPPLRNATTTTIAPTGSISILANTSSGVEPIFALAYIRRVMDDDELVEIHPIFEDIARREGFYSESLAKDVAETGSVSEMDSVPQRWRDVFRTSHDIAPDAHVRIQAAFQKFTDNAVSKTVNLPNSASSEDVRDLYLRAFELGCKGMTVYRDGSRESQVLNIKGSIATTTVDGLPRKRPEVVAGSTRKIPTGCGNLYVTINDNKQEPFELFAQIGKTGGCAASQTEAIGRLSSLALRAGIKPDAVVAQLRGIRCSSPNWNQGTMVLSCADAISKALDEHLADLDVAEQTTVPNNGDSLADRLAGQCIDCGSTLEYEGGCAVCRSCGYTRCG